MPHGSKCVVHFLLESCRLRLEIATVALVGETDKVDWYDSDMLVEPMCIFIKFDLIGDNILL